MSFMVKELMLLSGYPHGYLRSVIFQPWGDVHGMYTWPCFFIGLICRLPMTKGPNCFGSDISASSSILTATLFSHYSTSFYDHFTFCCSGLHNILFGEYFLMGGFLVWSLVSFIQVDKCSRINRERGSCNVSYTAYGLPTIGYLLFFILLFRSLV